jgi:hypothetical protein
MALNPSGSPSSAATIDASYMNFLRCVRAICTAASGTSSITVNPFTNNTGTIDSTRNCIISIISNTEAGGWTESTRSNVVQSGSFTSFSSQTWSTYNVFDAYNASGKGALPYNKLCFCPSPAASTSAPYYQTSSPSAYNTLTTYPFVCMTFGSSTSTDWTDTRFVPGGNAASAGSALGYQYDVAGASGSGYQNQSFSLNGNHSQNGTPYSYDSFRTNDPNRVFYMAVTASYCILWEQNVNNSYNTAPYYANTISTVGATSYSNNNSFYGSIMYGGLRETQAWENAISTNPPWVCFKYDFQRYSGASTAQPYGDNSMGAYLCTINDSGVVNTTPKIYWTGNTYSTPYFDQLTSYNMQNNTGASSNNQGLIQPFFTKDWGLTAQMGSNYTNQFYMPVVDPTTGTFVPSAYPIIARRMTSGSWTPGGAIRGLYRSLSMPIATMKNYFAPNQTFNIYNAVTQATDTYLPIIFNEDMFLVRFA